MKTAIESVFPICITNSCIWEPTSESLFIHDPKDGKCIIIDDKDLAHFIVSNPSLKALTFLAIDHCIWGDDSEHRKCDFAITDQITFVFVEIKDTYKRYPSHKASAKEQLEDTIKEFDEVFDMKFLSRKAIISWNFKKTYPAAKTKMQSAEVHFWDNYQVELMEGNSFSF